MPVTAPADRRFLRAHARPGRRRPAWRGPVVVAMRIAVGMALLLYAGYRVNATVQAGGLLHVRRIQVRGVDRLSRGEVLSLLEELRGQSIVGADLEACRQRLLKSPWVAEAVLRRRLPSTVEVVIAERRPIGIARVDADLYLVDDHGVVIEEYGPKYAELDLPVIDGLAPPHAGAAPGLDGRRVALAVRLLDSLQDRPDLLKRVSQLDVSDPHDAVVILDGDTALVRLGEALFAERLQSYLELAPKLRERVPVIDYVDLRFGNRVYVGTTTGEDAGAPRVKGTLRF
jgi:cell division protein FtsQ